MAATTKKAAATEVNLFRDFAPNQRWGWAPVYCAKHHFEILRAGERCQCPPGPQWRGMLAEVDELLFGGARMSAKSELGRGKLLAGNPIACANRPHPEKCKYVAVNGVRYCPYCVNASYINHPRYRALILRQNETDLVEWQDRAVELYTQLGAKITTKPLEFTWPSGAVFRCGHLNDSLAYTKYQGHEYHRILIEELTQIPDEKLYLQIRASCRSTFLCHCGNPMTCLCGALHPMVFATTNPGETGHAWVRRRFVDIGPPNKIWTNPDTGQTRLFIPSTIDDNPYADQSYKLQFEDLRKVDMAKYMAWRWGDWNCMSGGYFTTFRPTGPIHGAVPPEPEHANHVVRSGHYPTLAYWWPRFIGMDWGYSHRSVVLWGCKNQDDQRVHVYRELSIRECGAYELGMMVARMTLPELESSPDSHIPIYLSHDAFARRDARRSIAEQIREGIQAVIGANSVFMANLTESEKEIENEYGTAAALDAMKRRFVNAEQDYLLSLHESTRLRVDGWQKIRGLLRWLPYETMEPDHQFIARLREQPNGELRVHEYLAKLKNDAKQLDGPLPGILFWDCCKDLIQEIIDAVYDEGTEDILEDGQSHSMDALDALRYLIMGYLDVDNKLPKREFLVTRIRDWEQKFPVRSGDLFARMLVTAKANHDYQDPRKITFIDLGRAGSRVRPSVQ